MTRNDYRNNETEFRYLAVILVFFFFKKAPFQAVNRTKKVNQLEIPFVNETLTRF